MDLRESRNSLIRRLQATSQDAGERKLSPSSYALGMPLAAVPNLESELDGLYALPLEQFTKARNDLAARLRKAHQDDVADMVRALKKPSTVAWAANRLARDQPKQVDALLQAAERLRDAQQRSLAGEAKLDEVGEASSAEREAVRALLASARTALGERATAPLLERLSQTLRAAAIDETGRDLLQRGRLTEELKAAGFGPLEAVAPTRRRGDEVARAARERVTVLRSEARRLDGEAREAERAAADAARAAQILGDEAAEKRSEAERAASELAEAEADLGKRR